MGESQGKILDELHLRLKMKLGKDTYGLNDFGG